MEKPAGQTWLPVPNWEGLYEVSDLGLIWSCQRRRGTRGGLLKTPVDNRGYRQVNLCRDGNPVHLLLHVIVATTFHGPCPPGLECRHLDGQRTNNTAANLAWGTPSENNSDRVRHGTFRNRNTDKMRCDHGHQFTPENTGHWPDGRRYCIACRKRRHAEQSARRKAARAARSQATSTPAQ